MNKYRGDVTDITDIIYCIGMILYLEHQTDIIDISHSHKGIESRFYSSPVGVEYISTSIVVVERSDVSSCYMPAGKCH